MDGSCVKTKFRTPEEKKKLEIRLNRIIGQLNGVKQMIEENRYCDDILIQLAATEKSIKSLMAVILDNHMRTCLVESIKDGDLTVVTELVDLFKRF